MSSFAASSRLSSSRSTAHKLSGCGEGHPEIPDPLMTARTAALHGKERSWTGRSLVARKRATARRGHRVPLRMDGAASASLLLFPQRRRQEGADFLGYRAVAVRALPIRPLLVQLRNGGFRCRAAGLGQLAGAAAPAPSAARALAGVLAG